MFETCYDKLQPCFKQESIQLRYMDTDNFVLIVNTKHKVKDLENLEDILDFSNLNENHVTFKDKIKRAIGK